MRKQNWPKRDPNKNYFRVPNEIYHLGLSAGAIAVYGYLLHIEDRKTFRCHASYKTIGKATTMSANTVAKYVRELEDKHLIRTEPTTIVRARDGRKMNGSLLYNIRSIQEAVDYFHEQQMEQLEMESTRRQTAERATEYNRKHPQEPLCTAFADKAALYPIAPETGKIETVSESLRRTKEKAG